MKILLQIIALLIPGAAMLQVAIILGTGMLLLKLMINSLVVCRDFTKFRKGNKEAEGNLWAIE